MRTIRLFVVTAAVLGFSACASSAGPAASTTVASPASSSDARAIATAMDAATAPFVASRATKHFYAAACNTVNLIKPADRIGFASMKDAEAAGFSRDLYSTDCR